MSTIQSSCVPVGVSALEIAGSAKLRTVLSTDTSRTGSMRTASANQARRPARGAATAVGSVAVDTGTSFTAWRTAPVGRRPLDYTVQPV